VKILLDIQLYNDMEISVKLTVCYLDGAESSFS